jgi:hypothetical protein
MLTMSHATTGRESDLALSTLNAHFIAAGPPIDSNYGSSDAEIDRLIFGMSQRELEGETADYRVELEARYAGEAHCLSEASSYWTPYSVVRGVVRALNLGPEDTFYDLGAGYGALPIYAGAVTEATCKGVELTEHRVQAAQTAIGRLGLSNVEMIEASVLEHDFSDGSAFYLFAPFNFPTFFAVLDKLGEIAQNKPIKVVMRRMDGDWLNRGWLADAKKTKIAGSNQALLMVEAGPNS